MKKEINPVRNSPPKPFGRSAYSGAGVISNGIKKQKIAPKKINRSWNLAARMERKRVK